MKYAIVIVTLMNVAVSWFPSKCWWVDPLFCSAGWLFAGLAALAWRIRHEFEGSWE